jgi:thiamine-monophosphate kinase
VSVNSETTRLQQLLALFGCAPSDGIERGIGDDAAVLRASAERVLVWTVDAQVEDVHFRRGFLSWTDCGYRSFIAAASDISAMGASPWCALSALSLTSDLTDADLERLALGQRDAAEEVGAKIVGGNLSGGGLVTVTTTLLGRARRAVARVGAEPGDGLWMAGEAGLAAAGLLALVRGSADPRVEPAVHAWRRPRPRTREGLSMAVAAHAAIDISDGVALDAARLAEASEVCVVVDRAALLARGGDALGRAAEAVGAAALELALGGGEDYALIAASDVPIDGFARVGEIREGRGVILRDGRAEEPIANPSGFDHFAP